MPSPPASLHIELFGGVKVLGGTPAGNARAIGQPRRLALLALLADTSEGGITRDRVLGLLWPDVPEQRARHSLDQLLYALRGDLGADVVVSGTSLALSRTAVTCDLWDFDAAVRREDWAAAAQAYSGPFLDGFFAGGSEAFDHWTDARRATLRRQWLHALEFLALQADTAQDYAVAVRHWTRLAAEDPLSSPYALGLMRALAASGDSVGALRHASVHATLVADEIGTQPDRTVLAYAEELRARAGSGRTVAASSEQRVTPAHAAVSIVPNASGGRAALRLARVAALVIVILVAAGWLWVQGNSAAARDPTPPLRSLAVLPFADFSGGDQLYLGDALTDELINQLGAVGGLDVVGRTSAFAFKGKNVPLAEIGRELGVAHLLEGSVRHTNGRLRVNARLVTARTGYQVWTETYDVQADDMFGVQAHIARGIAKALKVTLASGGATPPTQDARAYDLYLKGRTLYLNAPFNDTETVRSALDLLTRAATHDPRFAAAHAGLADAFSRVGDPKRARAAAVEALRLDSTLAEAHAALAYLLAYYERDWEKAVRSIDRAIQLNPGYVLAYLRRSNMRAMRGEFEGAHADIERALHLDPLSPAVHVNQVLIDHFSGRYEDALPRLQRIMADNNRADLGFLLANIYLGLGWTSDAEAQLRRMGDTLWAAVVGGDRTRLDEVRRFLEARPANGDGRAQKEDVGLLAAIYIKLGDHRGAIAALEQLMAPPVPINQLGFWIWEPTFRDLQSAPEFERIRRILFPEQPIRISGH